MPSVTLDQFDGGLDVRAGSFSTKQNRFRVLTNRYPNSGKKIVRRMPLRQNAGTFGADTSGILVKDNVIYTAAPKGGGATLPTGTVALLFDAPTGTTATALLDLVGLNNVPVALMKHTLSSGAWLYCLHVFDGAVDQLTLVLDPAFPWSSKVSPADRPVLGASAGKVYCSGPEGDAYFSGVGRPRVWNTRTADTATQSGFDFLFYLPAGGVQTVTVPLETSSLGTLQNSGYTGAIIQRWFAGANGTPTDDTLFGSETLVTDFSLTEVSGAPGIGQTQRVSGGVPNTAPKTTFSNWAAYNINAGSAGFYRLRVLATTDSEIGYRPNDPLTGPFTGMHTVAGPIQPIFTTNATTAKSYPLPATFQFTTATQLWVVKINGTVKAWPADYSIGQTDDGKCKLVLVAAPTVNDLIEVSEKFYGATGLDMQIPPHQVRTFGGIKDFAGGTLVLPINSIGTMGILLDKSGIPVSLQFYASGTGMVKSDQYRVVLLLSFATDATNITGISYPHAKINRSAPDILKLFKGARAMAGNGDAGFLPTSKHPSGGGVIMDLTGTKDRLLVRYKTGAQVWDVHADPTLDSIQSLLPIGSGDQLTPFGILFFGQTVIVPSSSGLRGVSILSTLDDSLHDDENIGDAVSGLGDIQFLSAAFWPVMSCYLAAVTINGVFGMLTLHYHQDGKIVGWALWTFTGLTSVDYRGMAAVNDRLYIRSGANLFYLDASAAIGQSTFYDYNETAATAYADRTVWHFSDFKAPMAMKWAQELNVLQTGKATFSFKVNPYQDAQQTPGIVIKGATIGRPKIPLCAQGMGLALVMDCNDPTGHQLDGVSVEYRLARR